ncbi:MAG TPA: lipocalin family protein [Gemmataceae bacterium]|nr:lipocalin family protein [Gemmataceae bacterium]
MQLLRWSLVGCLIIGLAGCGGGSSTKPASSADSKSKKSKEEAKPAASNKDKIVGTWELTKGGGEMPPGAIIELTKDGKMKISVKDPKGQTQTMDGTYTVDGDKLITGPLDKDGKPIKGKDGKEMKDTMTILKLTDTELVTKDEKGKTDEFKKKK